MSNNDKFEQLLEGVVQAVVENGFHLGDGPDGIEAACNALRAHHAEAAALQERTAADAVAEVTSINGCPIVLWDKSLPVGTKLYAATIQPPAVDVDGQSHTGNAEADRIINRLNSSDPDFDDCAAAIALIYKLVAEHKGPEGFATWKDAAIAERIKHQAAAAVDVDLRNRLRKALGMVTSKAEDCTDAVMKVLVAIQPEQVSKDPVKVQRLWASGGKSWVHDFKMTDGSIRTMSNEEANAIGYAEPASKACDECNDEGCMYCADSVGGQSK